MKKQASSRRSTPKLPVSDNFYTSIKERVASAAGVCGGNGLEREVMAVIDRYMIECIEPHGEQTEVMLIFTLLKSEIDKAVKRSAAARARGKRRHESSVDEMADTQIPAADDSEKMSEALALTPNRKQRRLMENERRRATRRKIKPLSGWRK
ncbi:MAG: hypothetical protein NC212_01235 [Staphylococcus sp.]|nr:hypothetical protein [Staphylococcus sp.]